MHAWILQKIVKWNFASINTLLTSHELTRVFLSSHKLSYISMPSLLIIQKGPLFC